LRADYEPGKNEKRCLKGVLGIVVVEHAAANAPNHAAVPVDKGREGRFVRVVDERRQQLPVRCCTLMYRLAKVPDYSFDVGHRRPPWPLASGLYLNCVARSRFIRYFAGRFADGRIAQWGKNFHHFARASDLDRRCGIQACRCRCRPRLSMRPKPPAQEPHLDRPTPPGSGRMPRRPVLVLPWFGPAPRAAPAPSSRPRPPPVFHVA
jgi:hypothetical protein